MDNPSQEPSNAPLNASSAADAFLNLFDAPKEPDKTPEALEAEALDELTKKQPESEKPEPEDAVEASEADGETVTIEVDGKTVELTKAELADAYKNGLRQADYTQKTMAAADARKSADAETAKAFQERQAYAGNLQKMAVQLEGVLEQSSKIDWDALISADPVEAMKQQHLLQKRQAAYQDTVQQLQAIDTQTKAEQADQMRQFRQVQQQELLAKLPDWKDESRAKAESAAIKSYLKNQGFDDAAIDNIQDHRAVILGRKAMLYDQMMSKATAAAKKVQALPTRVVRPGVADSQRGDGRSSAMQRLSRSGSVNDAADAFKAFL